MYICIVLHGKWLFHQTYVIVSHFPGICSQVSMGKMPPTFATFCCQASGGDESRETFGLLVLQPLGFPSGFRGHGRRALALALKRGNSI